MIYSYNKLRELVKDGFIVNEATDNQLQAASIDITLGNTFKVPVSKKPIIKLGIDTPEYEGYVGSVIIKPHSFILATTKETINIPNNMGAWIEGKSSIGRSGLFIQNAGWIAPGFKGEITLELYNANDYCLEISTGLSIGQIVVCSLDEDTAKPYKGRYAGQIGATAPISNNEEVYDCPIRLKIYPTNIKLKHGECYSGLKDSLIRKDQVAEFESHIFNIKKDSYAIHFEDAAVAQFLNEGIIIDNQEFIKALYNKKANLYITDEENPKLFSVIADINVYALTSSTGFRFIAHIKVEDNDNGNSIFKLVSFDRLGITTNAIWGS